MAKSFYGTSQKVIMDSIDRRSSNGADGLIVETVECPATAGKISLFNSEATAYTKTPTDATTGAAILGAIKHILGVSIIASVSTVNEGTTTVAYMTALRKVNGPTTVAELLVHKNNDGVLYSVTVFGKAF